MKIKAIDLFAEIGGIRMGFEQAFGDEIETVFASDFDKFACQTYKANFHDNFEVFNDITKVEENNIPGFDICLAGFPCQAFSKAGKLQGFNDNYFGQTRGTLFFDLIRICDFHKPKVIFAENVKGLLCHDKGRSFKIMIDALEKIGYRVFYQVLNSKDFGVPQKRERVYIVAFRNDVAPVLFEFPVGEGRPTCIKDIMEEDVVDIKYYMSVRHLKGILDHKARQRAKGNKFGGGIYPIDGLMNTIVKNGVDQRLIVDKRQTDLTPPRGIKGEMNTDGVRKLTPRESARCQGFPDSFILPCSDTQSYKQIGNSVTVPVIRAIATRIREIWTFRNF